MADVLLVIQHCNPISRYTIPSKTYEYLLLDRHILGLTYHNPELDDLLHRHGHRAVPVNDVERISAEIERIYDDWVSGRLVAPKQESLPTADTAAAELAEFVDSLPKVPR